VAILLLAAAIRLAASRENQTLWPDEAVYLLAAKSFAGLADYDVPAARPILLPLLWSLLYRAGLGEPAIRLTGVAFSLLSVHLAWRLGQSLHGVGAALGASFLLAVFWLDVFLAERFLTDGPALALWLLALLVIVRSQLEANARGTLWLGPILALLVLARLGSAVLLPVAILLLAIARGPGMLRDRRLWCSAGLGLLVLLPYLVWCSVHHGSPLAPLFQREAAVSPTYATRVPMLYPRGLRAYVEWFPSLYLDPFLCALLVLGAIAVARQLVRARDGEVRRRAALLLAWPVATLLVFGALIDHAEARFLLPLFPAAFLLIARGLGVASALASRRSRLAAAAIVALALACAGHRQVATTGAWMQRYSLSTWPNRVVATWLREHASPDATIYAAEPEINQFYSGLRSRWYPETREQFEAERRLVGAAYLVVERLGASQPDWVSLLIAEQEWRPLFAHPPMGAPAASVYRLPALASGAPPGEPPSR
jgi:4-amino-4-deoxy-L-arabinose transferase-like glycosyltransferase